MANPLTSDLDHVLAKTDGLWDELRGRRIFITGGTGFFGCWLLESLLWANDKLGLNAKTCVLTRNPDAFRNKAPHIVGHPSIEILAGDVRTFEFPSGEFSHVIHAATDASNRLIADEPLAMFDVIVEGTRHMLDFTSRCGAKKFLLTSSGAVYGRQPSDVPNISEEYAGAPDPLDPGSVYGEGKRAAELLCAVYSKIYGIETKIARCFAFVGPYLPLDEHFAIGNFIRDGIGGGPIRVGGDGTPYRSYLYAADLAVWLWTILMRGRSCRPYNVGSERSLTIAEVANTVANAFQPPLEVVIAKEAVPGKPAARYVPSTQNAQRDLNLEEYIDSDDAVRRTINWQLVCR
ncbi:MAG: NAD-dependent epimerase/dehydratase family protein [Armatimonadota bacterium]